ncbi:DUF447 domain-containing protein [Crateriforma conspicua]|uniref:DUF447 family protein n=1 Tax=Crateriforma conspicua TaxID=2527996 RepID=A0A5C5Y626_9PLAN|nr:DUF447 domain-containing protein [Crateriforma conspicua]QDV65275.1 hypothetical protein Mal65_44450 [Crateriforma conspicua]TWT70670.1 hypothetical protein Pan14r_29770 [Crateriforma conspicua]
MILESLVTTIDQNGHLNLAPMGPVVDGPQLRRFVLRPYQGSTTCANLLETGRATIHVCDDVSLFAKTAIGSIDADALVVPVTTADGEGFWRLKRCHRWFAVAVTDISGGDPKYEMQTRMVASGIQDPFFGFNRAKHAVIEACILATRIHLLDAQDIRDQMKTFAVAVTKTGGKIEQQAFAAIADFIDQRMES